MEEIITVQTMNVAFDHENEIRKIKSRYDAKYGGNDCLILVLPIEDRFARQMAEWIDEDGGVEWLEPLDGKETLKTIAVSWAKYRKPFPFFQEEHLDAARPHDIRVAIVTSKKTTAILIDGDAEPGIEHVGFVANNVGTGSPR